jgi:hypothetical protein
VDEVHLLELDRHAIVKVSFTCKRTDYDGLLSPHLYRRLD